MKIPKIPITSIHRPLGSRIEWWSLLLMLPLLVGGSISTVRAQLIFSFNQVGGDVVMTSSGSMNTALLTPTSATGWGGTGFQAGTPNIIGSNLAGYNTGFRFSDGTDFSAWADGSGPFSNSFFSWDLVQGTTSFATYTSYEGTNPGLLVNAIDIIEGIWTPDNIWTEYESTLVALGLIEGTYTVTDSVTGASISFIVGAGGPVGPSDEELELSSSAIPMNLAAGQIGSNVHHQAVRGINNRLFRARARTTAENLRRFPVSLRQSSGFPSAESSAKAASPDTVAAGDNWEYFVSGSFGDVGLDNLGANPGLDSSTYNSTVGFEYKVSDPLSVGLGWSHLWSDNDMDGGLGSVDMEGDAAIVYATWFKNNVWADLLYGYGIYEADIRRPNGGGTSVASPDLTAHQLSLNLGYNIEADTANTWLAALTAGDNRLVYGPTLGVDYSTGTLDGYAETGSPGFDAVFGDQDFDSLIVRVGGQATHSTRINWGRFQSQLRLEYAHESQDQGNTVSGSLVADPLITATGTDLAAGSDWLEAGAGVSLDVVGSDVTVYADYIGQFFRSDMTSSYFTLGAKMRF